MRYLNSSELSQFHDAFLAMCEKHATAKSVRRWGHPHGVIICDTYSFETQRGTLYIGHCDFDKERRWWIPIILKSQVFGKDLTIAFEMNIPKMENLRLSVHYAIDDDNCIHILHKGKVTVGHGAVGMYEFFDYYKKNPGRWPIIDLKGYDYLELGKVSLPLEDHEFPSLIESLAEFANYVPGFKDHYR
jgi:hypothetical protein